MLSSRDAGPETIGDLVKARRWKETRRSLGEDPELAFWVDPSNSRTALHIMCRLDLGQNDANGREVAETETSLPPHIEVAQMLINLSHEIEPVILPNPVTLGDGEGFDMVMHMSILTVKDYLGDTVLHNLCGHMRSACPHLVQLILSSVSGTAFTFKSIKEDGLLTGDLEAEESRHSRAPNIHDLLTTKNSHGCTPMHFIGEGSAPRDISNAIFDACRGAKRNPMIVQDEDGDTPLHFACSAGMDPEFLEHFQDAVLITNNEGRLPVDDLIVWFVDENDSDSEAGSLLQRSSTEMLTVLWQRVSVLLAAADGLVRHEDLGTRTFRPVHAAAGMQAFPSLVLRLACKLFPDELSSRDEAGLTALHVAASHAQRASESLADPDTENYSELVRWKPDCEDDTMITFLSSLSPDSAKLFSCEGRLPLHMAINFFEDDNHNARASVRHQPAGYPVIKAGKNIADIEHLLSLSPCSLETRDKKTRLQPFMLAAVDENASLDLVYILLLRNPELVRSVLS